MTSILPLYLAIFFALLGTGQGPSAGRHQQSQERLNNTARAFLKKHYQKDLAQDLIFEQSRKFRAESADLNKDGKPEIFIALTGPYFCGSGGCSFLLLDASGKLMTTFTVSDYPISVTETYTLGWRNLVIYSNHAYRLVRHGRSAYPANPSVQPATDLKKEKVYKKLFNQPDAQTSWQNF